MIKKHPQNGSSKGIPTFLLASGLQWWRSIILKLTTVPVPVHSMEMFYNSEAEPDRELLKLETAYTRLCTGKIGEPMTLEWEKIQGGILLHETYIYDTKEKSDPRDTNRFLLLSHGKLSCFLVSGTEWTFSCAVRVDSPLDDSPREDLVEIARSTGKFGKDEEASKRPFAKEYLSVLLLFIYHC